MMNLTNKKEMTNLELLQEAEKRNINFNEFGVNDVSMGVMMYGDGDAEEGKKLLELIINSTTPEKAPFKMRDVILLGGLLGEKEISAHDLIDVELENNIPAYINTNELIIYDIDMNELANMEGLEDVPLKAAITILKEKGYNAIKEAERQREKEAALRYAYEEGEEMEDLW